MLVLNKYNISPGGITMSGVKTVTNEKKIDSNIKYKFDITNEEAKLIEKGLSLLSNKVSKELRCIEDGYELEREKDLEIIEKMLVKLFYI